MERKIINSLKVAKKRIGLAIKDIEEKKDWKAIHKDIISALNLIKISTRKYVIANMLKTTTTSEFMKLYRDFNPK